MNSVEKASHNLADSVTNEVMMRLKLQNEGYTVRDDGRVLCRDGLYRRLDHPAEAPFTDDSTTWPVKAEKSESPRAEPYPKLFGTEIRKFFDARPSRSQAAHEFRNLLARQLTPAQYDSFVAEMRLRS